MTKCPVCEISLQEPLPHSCGQCGWDLENDISFQTWLGDIPQDVMNEYSQRVTTAKRYWNKELEALKRQQAEIKQQEQKPFKVDSRSGSPSLQDRERPDARQSSSVAPAQGTLLKTSKEISLERTAPLSFEVNQPVNERQRKKLVVLQEEIAIIEREKAGTLQKLESGEITLEQAPERAKRVKQVIGGIEGSDLNRAQ